MPSTGRSRISGWRLLQVLAVLVLAVLVVGGSAQCRGGQVSSSSEARVCVAPNVLYLDAVADADDGALGDLVGALTDGAGSLALIGAGLVLVAVCVALVLRAMLRSTTWQSTAASAEHRGVRPLAARVSAPCPTLDELAISRT